jgi:uncharacterized protein YbjQ (UPF0145 family)
MMKMAEKFDLVFEGKIAPGQDEGAVKQALMKLLKIDDSGVRRLFGGGAVAIKKNLDEGTAGKFQQAFETTGALCSLVPQGVAPGFVPKDHADGPPSLPPQPPAAQVENHTVAANDGSQMIITNIETVPGRKIVEHFGVVSGSTIRAKHVGKDILAGFKNLVGGELKAYTQLLQESRQEAVDRMIAEARQVGANAIVNVRFSTSSVAAGAAELYAYGTAVSVA